MASKKSVQKPGASPVMRNSITIVLLLMSIISPVFGLIGVILMWFWTRWKKWVKILITIPIVLYFVVFVLAVVGVLIYGFLLRPYQVNGQGMAPSFRDTAYVLTSIVNPKNADIKRGDVVIYTPPEGTFTRVYIKRVVGLPDETIMLQGGQVYINGKQLDEKEYLPSDMKTFEGTSLKEGQGVMIPEGNYVVMGDNRINSSDSRDLGFVPVEKIISKVLFCYSNCK